jgi:hypothetical protein
MIDHDNTCKNIYVQNFTSTFISRSNLGQTPLKQWQNQLILSQCREEMNTSSELSVTLLPLIVLPIFTLKTLLMF